MNERLLDIRVRRARLQAKIEAQRNAVGVITARWERPLAVADAGLTALRFVKTHPVLIAGAGAGLVFYRRGTSGLLQAGWRLWRLYRSALTLAARFRP